MLCSCSVGNWLNSSQFLSHFIKWQWSCPCCAGSVCSLVLFSTCTFNSDWPSSKIDLCPLVFMKKDATLVLDNRRVHLHAAILSIDGNTKSIPRTNRVRGNYSEWRIKFCPPPPIDWWPKHMIMSIMAACFCNRIMNIVFSCAQQWMATFSPILCFCRSLFIFIYSKFFSKTVSKFPPAETPTKTNFIISSVQVCMLLYVLTKQFSDFPTAVISENIWNICSCELNGFLTGFLVLFADILGISDDHSESVSSIFCTLC